METVFTSLEAIDLTENHLRQLESEIKSRYWNRRPVECPVRSETAAALPGERAIPVENTSVTQ